MVEKSTKDGEYCVDQSVGDGYVMRECQNDLEVCITKRCFKKCCPEGQSYVGGGTCKDTYVFGMVTENQSYSPYIDDIKDDYEVIYGTGCPKVRLNFNNTIQYRIDQNGTFIYYHNYSESFVQEPVFNFYSYCLEHAEKGSIYGYYLFTCYNFKEIDVKFTHTLWAKIMSCIFLVFTIVIYFLVGETKNTFGKILINYCVNVILLMVTLMVSQIDVLPTRLECKLRGYFIIIFTLASFAWFNIMSLNIWWTFSTPKRMIGSDQKRKELKKFLLYFLYGWGMPISLALLILLLENTAFLPKVIQPYVGIFFCSLENRNYAPIVFFLLPQLIFQVVNTTLFVKTIIYCIKVKNDINRLNDLSKDNGNGKFSVAKERLGLIIKLGIVMGVIWIFEVATAFFTKMHSYNAFTKYLEVVLDNLICLQGTFIFLIFICKRKTFNKLKKRLSFSGQSASHSSCTTQSTSFCPMNKKQNTRTNLDEA
ncbi:G-protein coupled receptor Mth2-like isoform X2 [Sitophilus oryzae]|nr:G-protein coupled receptor Mth2-like isoform X2 [Sitophilus oryzae]